MNPLIAQTPAGAGIGVLQSILGNQWGGVDQSPAPTPDPILAAVAQNAAVQQAKKTIQPVQGNGETVQSGALTPNNNINANTVTGPGANPVLAAATPPAGADPNAAFNKLAVGQVVNGGKVLDANVFNSTFLPQFGSAASANEISNGAPGATNFQVSSGNDPTLGKKLGNNLGSNSLIKLTGFTPLDASGYQAASGGDSRQEASYNWDTSKLLSAAKAAGVDTSGYKAPDNTQAYDKSSQDLQNQINAANFKKASSDPNAIFSVDSQRVGNKEQGQYGRNLTYYVQRGDRLIPVQSQDYTRSSELKDTWKGVAPLIAIAASAFLGPEVAAAFGGGIGGGIGAGATLGAVQSGLSGGNILKGAALGGLGGGVSAGVSQAASGLGAGADLSKIIGGAAAGGAKAFAGGTDPLTGTILGGVGGATGAIGSTLGIGNSGASFLDAILKQGIGSTLQRGKKP